MLETFNARMSTAVEVENETGVIACPCAIFPEVSGIPEIRDVIDSVIAELVRGMRELNPAAEEWFHGIGGEAAVGHGLTIAAAAGYAAALDSTPSGESFDPAHVDWDNLPNIDDPRESE